MESIYTYTELKQMTFFARKLGYQTLKTYIQNRVAETKETFNEALMEIYESAMDHYIDTTCSNGHNWGFSSADIGPDSGSESYSCEDCGYTVSHTYY